MSQVDAIYQNGVFKPLQDVGLPERQRVLVIRVVAGLVGVDEHEIERARARVARERLQRFARRREAQVDAVGYAGFLPVASADVGPFAIDVAAHEAAVGRWR